MDRLVAFEQAVTARPAAAALLTDFDGTLSAIVDDPAAACAWPGAVDALDALAARLGLVAVVTGRPAAWVVDQLGPVARHVGVSGLYGLEWCPAGGAVEVAPQARRWAPAVAEVAERAAAAAPAGVLIEPKGWSVTFHFRTAPEHEPWVVAHATAEGARTGLRVVPGKAHLELRPPVAFDKGTALDALAGSVDGLAALAFCGDDVGDLPAFAALAHWQASGVATIGVAAVAGAVDPAVPAAADVVLAGPVAVVGWLAGL